MIRSISRKFNLREKLIETELIKFLEQNKNSEIQKQRRILKTGKPAVQIKSEADKRLLSLEKGTSRIISAGFHQFDYRR